MAAGNRASLTCAYLNAKLPTGAATRFHCLRRVDPNCTLSYQAGLFNSELLPVALFS